MIRLDNTTRKLQAILAGAITANQLPVLVSYSDKTTTTYAGGSTLISTNSTTAVDIAAAPAASTVRDVDTITVQNADTATATITVRYNDNGTLFTLFKAVLAVGDQVTYAHGTGWKVFDSTGAVKSSQSTAGLEQTANKDASGGYAGLTSFKINFKNAANTFTNFLTNATTAARTYTFPDFDGTMATLAGTEAFTNKTYNGNTWTAGTGTLAIAAGKTATVNNTMTFAGTDSTTLTMPAASDTMVGRASTDTLTNKRVTARRGTTTSSATPTINTDNVDTYALTAQTADITSFTTNLSGTPTADDVLFIQITGTAARAITWGSSFEASTVALPTTTVTTARLDVSFVWNSVTSKWRCVGVA